MSVRTLALPRYTCPLTILNGTFCPSRLQKSSCSVRVSSSLVLSVSELILLLSTTTPLSSCFTSFSLTFSYIPQTDHSTLSNSKCGKRKMHTTMNSCMNMYICNVLIFPLSSSRLFLIKKRVREAGKSSILIIKQGCS